MHTDEFNSRRLFIKQLLTGSSVLMATAYASCRPANQLEHIKGTIVGANSAAGHLVRNAAALPKPSRNINADILIVGGGISGLSAKRWLNLHGKSDVMLLEMDNHFGGNSFYGRNGTSAYPWGAHYIPVPDMRNTELTDFLKGINVITGYDDKGMPVYNEYYMCHEPEERLFINGLWQEGMLPNVNLTEKDKTQMEGFFKLVEGFKNTVGTDGKDAFAIPLRNSSADDCFRQLDKISFSQYLQQEGYDSKYLLWYLEYGCKDDYATNLQQVSAWAGIHYFSSRKGKGANATSSTVLTWPQGNGFLMEHLRSQAGDAGMFSGHSVYKMKESGNGVEVFVYDISKKESYCITANKVIVATPQFVNKYLLADTVDAGKLNAYKDFHYAPWVIANITINNFPRERGLPLCWDNVIYDKPSVGYVNANHQDLGPSNKKVITFYMPYAHEEPDVAREKLRSQSYNDLLTLITNELEFAHPGITENIETADIWIWAHGMISPRTGFIWGDSKKTAAEPVNDKIFFAHSDLSGISIFEEAFYQGINAANKILSA